jgi:mono/diheme cytochrome c family protein
MLRKILIGLLIVIGFIVIVGVVAGYVMKSKTENRMTNLYDVDVMTIPIPTDSVSLAKGERWAGATCAGCHGSDFSGKDLINDEGIGRIVSPNITSGKGGITAAYRVEDWIRVIRHGIKPSGMSTVAMPSQDLGHMSDEDLGAMIAHLQTIPPVDKEWPLKPELTTMGKILMQAGAFGEVFSAEVIDHSVHTRSAPAAGATAEYGGYITKVSGCVACHGAELNGGLSPEPGAPVSPNLTPGGNLGNWSRNDFISTMRYGTTPEGHEMDPKYMPWDYMGKFNDEELAAMYVYFRSLPAMESAVEVE